MKSLDGSVAQSILERGRTQSNLEFLILNNKEEFARLVVLLCQQRSQQRRLILLGRGEEREWGETKE